MSNTSHDEIDEFARRVEQQIETQRARIDEYDNKDWSSSSAFRETRKLADQVVNAGPEP